MTKSEFYETCLICLEGENCYKMTMIFNYTKECSCDCIVHQSCLYHWHSVSNNKCIICKKLVFINNTKFNKSISPEVNNFQEDLIKCIQMFLVILICYTFLYVYLCCYIQFHNMMMSIS